MARVFVPNDRHDVSAAERFGRLIFLTEGVQDRLDVQSLYRNLADIIGDAQADDFLIVSSLPIILSVASSILATQTGVVNYLFFVKGGRYIHKRVEFGAVQGLEQRR